MSSDTTANLVKTIVTRLLAYTDDAGRTLSSYVGSGSSARIYVSLAPDPVSYPYIILRKINTEGDSDLANLAEEFDVDIKVVHAPRSKEQEAELLADLCDGALLTWRESSSANGLSYGMHKVRDTEEPNREPPDRAIVEVKTRIRCRGFPKYNTNALT